MSFYPTPLGCRKAHSRPNINDRHWGHWRWLLTIAQPRRARAFRLWRNLFHKKPHGLLAGDDFVRLNLEDSK